MISIISIIVLSYLIGSFPTAVLTSRILMKDDIRNHGSHNAGATNVFRVMGWKPALFVVLIDIGKGLIAVSVVSTIRFGPVPVDHSFVQILAGAAAIIGHVWTLFAGFRGGKGVGTAFGVLLSLMPVPALITFGIWIGLVLITRIVSVGSISAALVLPVTLILQKQFYKPDISVSFVVISILTALLILFTHRSNIGRLLRGEEHRFGSQSKKERGKSSE
jgi:glycerol-3-phosphate acyltransferase PlsY